MKLLLINGSPRGKGSNTKLLFDKFIEGLVQVETAHEVETVYLNQLKKVDKVTDLFANAENVIIGFPLYADAMPGIVMNLFEKLPSSENKNVGFLVQSGFPEAYQSSFIKNYLDKLAKRMHWNYQGTIIKGGVEGIQIMPAKMTRKLFAHFIALGKYYAKNRSFDQDVVNKLATPYQLSKFRYKLVKVLSKIGLINFYWNSNLKKHKAYEKRFDAPYV